MKDQITQRGFRDNAPTIVNVNEAHMACLLLVDTSGSMAGDPIQELNAGIKRFIEQVGKDSITRKVLDLAIVAFDTTVRTVVPFTPIQQVEPVQLEASGGTDMAGGLREAIAMIDERYRVYMRTGTQPYCPWIVMITDGYPNGYDPSNESVSGELQELIDQIQRMDDKDKMRLWSLAVSGADTKLLNRIGHGKRVLILRDYNFESFFDWVHKSMRAISISSPGERPQGQDLPVNVDKAISNEWM